MKKTKKILSFALVVCTILSVIFSSVTVTNAAETLNGVYSYNIYKNMTDEFTAKKSYDFQLNDGADLYIVSDTAPSEELMATVRLAQKQFNADGYELNIKWGAKSGAGTGDVLINIDGTYKSEQYRLTVTNKASVTASDMRGVLYGLNALQKHLRVADAYVEANPDTNRTPHTIKGFDVVDTPDTKERTVHLDCGRKYFTKEWICNYIREMSWMGYNALELHFSEDGGFRVDFWDNKTDFISPTGNDFSWVCGGQKPSFNTQSDDDGYDYNKYLTSKELKEICEVAKEYHIEIIPSFDTPAHVSWLTTAYHKQGNSTFYYNDKKYTLPAVINYRGSYSVDNSTCLQLGDANVKRFAYAMYTDIAAFFKQYADSAKFNICGDEVVLTNKSVDGWDYADFVKYVNNLNTLLKKQGYTVRMYNDFADRADYASKASADVPQLAGDIQIVFWDGPDSSKDNIRSAKYWVNDNRVIYSGNQFWTYYVLHRLDNPANKTWLSSNGLWNMDVRNSDCTIMYYHRNGEKAVYSEWNPTRLSDWNKTDYYYSGSQLAGGYFMIWCNYAALNTEVEMWNGVTDSQDSSQKYSLRNRMWANIAKQWNWDMNSSVTFSKFMEACEYMGDFPGLNKTSGGISKKANFEIHQGDPLIRTSSSATGECGVKVTDSKKRIVFDHVYYYVANPELKAVFGTDADLLYRHYLNHGIAEGLQAHPTFDARYYLENNPDLKSAYGDDYVLATKHYLSSGYKEGRATASPVNLGSSFTAKITTRGGSKNVTVSSADKTNVVISTASTSAAQNWKFVCQADGSYKITNTKYKKVLDVESASSGANVFINTDTGAKTQRWFVYQKGNSYVLKSAGATVSVLDLTDKSTAKGTSVIQATTDATNTQRFYINMV